MSRSCRTSQRDRQTARLHAEAHLSALAERAGTLLTEHRASVLAVGHALELRKTISGQDVVAIINGELGPVVDGRPYHRSGFVAELEAYHRRAVGAHSGDRSLPLPIPVPAQSELALLLATPTEHCPEAAPEA